MKQVFIRFPAVVLLALFLLVAVGFLPALAMVPTDDYWGRSSSDDTATPTETGSPTATETVTGTVTAEPTETATATATVTSTVVATRTPEATQTPRPMEVKFRGTVQSKSNGTYVIDGRTVTTNVNTQYEPNAAAVVVCAFVEVEGYAQNNGSILAKEIHVESAPGGTVDTRVEFRGPIQRFSASVWVVAGRTISITASTEIRGTPVIGAIAEVKAILKADGSLIAIRIQVEDADEDRQRVEFKGVISAFSSSQWTVGGRVVLINANTVISGTPQIGLVAEVKAINNNGTLTAVFIKVERPQAAEIEFKGTITSINGNNWVVGGKIVVVSATTLVDESRARARVGAVAEVKGILQGDGSVLATRIKIERSG